MKNMKIANFIYFFGFFLLFGGNTVVSFGAQNRVNITIDPRSSDHITPQQWHEDNFIKLNKEEQDVVVACVTAATKRLETSITVIQKQIDEIKSDGSIINSLTIMAEAAQFNFNLAKEHARLNLVITNYFKAITCSLSKENLSLNENDYNDREKVIKFLKQGMKSAKMIAEKSRECLAYCIKQ